MPPDASRSDVRTPRSNRVDLRFVPSFHKAGALNLGLLATDLNVLFGHFEGALIDDDGARSEVSGLLGWAEEHLARW